MEAMENEVRSQVLMALKQPLYDRGIYDRWPMTVYLEGLLYVPCGDGDG